MAEEFKPKSARVLLVVEGREPIELKPLEEFEYDASAGTYANPEGSTWCNAYVEGKLTPKSGDDLIAEMKKIRDDFDQRYPMLKAYREALKPLALEPLPMSPPLFDFQRDALESLRLRFYDQPIVSVRGLDDFFMKNMIEQILPARISRIEHDQIVVDIPVRDKRFNQRHRENAPRNPFPPASPFKRARR